VARLWITSSAKEVETGLLDLLNHPEIRDKKLLSMPQKFITMNWSMMMVSLVSFSFPLTHPRL